MCWCARRWKLSHFHDGLAPQSCFFFSYTYIPQVSFSSTSFHSAATMGSWDFVPLLLATASSALLLIQMDTRVAALVVKPLLRARPISPVEPLVMMPLVHFLRASPPVEKKGVKPVFAERMRSSQPARVNLLHAMIRCRGSMNWTIGR
jgi:hypothetical protein